MDTTRPIESYVVRGPEALANSIAVGLAWPTGSKIVYLSTNSDMILHRPGSYAPNPIEVMWRVEVTTVGQAEHEKAVADVRLALCRLAQVKVETIEIVDVRASLAEMRAQAEEVKALRALPARDSAAAATPLSTLVASGTLAQGIPGARLSALGPKRVRLAVDDASWTRLVEWIAAAGANHGLAVEEATVEALPAAGRVRASLVLAAS